MYCLPPSQGRFKLAPQIGPQWQVEKCALSESCRAHHDRRLADRVLDYGKVSEYSFLLHSQFICRWMMMMSLDLRLALWRSSHLVGWMSDYEGHQSKEASSSKQKFKILFICIVYKATWKAMKRKAFISLLCLPTFLHLRMRPKVHYFLSAIRRRIRFFKMLW